MRLGSVEIGPGHPCRIVAELSNNHNGDRDRLGRLIDAAQAAGADIVKFQCYTPDELVALRGDGPAPEPWGSQGYSMRSLYERAQTLLDWFDKIAAHCERIGMPWFSSVFGAESLACLEAVGCPAYKISHFECGNDELAAMVLKTGKPVIVSQGIFALASHYWTGAIQPHLRANVGVLYCPGEYPAQPDRMHLDRMTDYLPDYIGLSSHCLHPMVVPVAIARGAHVIEYHMQLAAEPSELESNVSLNEREFAVVVQMAREAEVLLG